MLKKLIIYATSIGIFVFSMLVVFGFIFKDQLVNSVQNELNKQLNAEIITQHIDLSFIQDFPRATIIFYDVVGFESKNYSATPDTLFQFEEFELSFNILQVIKGVYVLEHISASEGFLNLEVNTLGEQNFELLQKSADTTRFLLDIESVQMTNCFIGYRDFSTTNNFQFYFSSVKAKGIVSSEKVVFDLYGDTQVSQLILGETSFLKNEKASFDIGLEVGLDEVNVQIHRGRLLLREEFWFDVIGKSLPNQYQFSFSSKNLDLASGISLIPTKYVTFLNQYSLNGNVDLNLKLSQGKGQRQPTILGDFSLRKGVFSNKENAEKIKFPNAQGDFNLGKNNDLQTIQLHLRSIEIATSQGTVSGAINVQNLIRPKFDLSLQGVADLKQISDVFNLGNFSMSGEAQLKLSLAGKLNTLDSIASADIRNFKGKAVIQLSRSSFEVENIPSIKIDSAKMYVNEQKIWMNHFSGYIDNSASSGSLELLGWLPFVLNQQNTLNIQGAVNTQFLKVENWSNSSETDKKIELPQNLDVDLDFSINQFEHEALSLSFLKGNLMLSDRKVALTQFSFYGFEGQFHGDYFLKQYQNGFVVSGKLKTQNVDLNKVLKRYQNFGQKVITDAQLSGFLNSAFSFTCETNNAFELNQNTLKLEGDFSLYNGVLDENTLLTSIPSQIEENKIIALFVNLDEFEKRLHHIKFDTIQNHITIEKGVIQVPRMQIRSSAMVINLNGYHSFSNEFDYYLDFNLREVLSKKAIATNEYGFIEDNSLGERMIYLHAFTKNGEVVVEVDKLGAKKRGERSTGVGQELKKAKEILQNELKIFTQDSLNVAADSVVKFDFAIDLGEFEEAADSTQKEDSSKTDSSKTLFKRKKKKVKKENFEEFEFEDDDY